MKNNYILIIFLGLSSCISDVKTGIPFESNSIEFSKKYNVLKFVYQPNVRQIRYKGKWLKILESWTELSWCYADTDMNIKKLDPINLVIRFDNEDESLFELKGRRLEINNIVFVDTGGKIHVELSNAEQAKDTLEFQFDADDGTIPIKFIKVK